MHPIIDGPPQPGDPPKPLLSRLAWFAVLWLGSLIAAGAIVAALRVLMGRV